METEAQEQLLSIEEALKARHSVRNYTGVWSEDKQKIVQQIVDEVNQIQAPYGTDASVGLHGPGIGRLGFISNESGWLLIKIPKDKVNTPDYNKYLIDASFRAHIAVMKLTQHKIGTVWIGGTFNEGLAEQSNPDFQIPVVVAYGIEAGEKRYRDYFIGFLSGPKRKPFDTFFYDVKAGKMMKEEEAGNQHDFLMYLRQCPTSMNNQPMRLNVKENYEYELFDASGKSYVDMGIYLACAYFFSEGKIKIFTEPSDATFSTGGKYVCKFTLEPSVFH
ncbi:nitroreductase [Histomonas meleagridis]|uniref:nitroreductase n=1 Tax=Histomonas meleagridis TaxID=135588 RepID=UPI0035598B9F|nr:nitroreductase [Histomonas meleagridis]KAH0801623.1 nitroreductase [Histomonas meleagridis]